jgi:hypothetical protein
MCVSGTVAYLIPGFWNCTGEWGARSVHGMAWQCTVAHDTNPFDGVMFMPLDG